MNAFFLLNLNLLSPLPAGFCVKLLPAPHPSPAHAPPQQKKEVLLLVFFLLSAGVRGYEALRYICGGSCFSKN